MEMPIFTGHQRTTLGDTVVVQRVIPAGTARCAMPPERARSSRLCCRSDRRQAGSRPVSRCYDFKTVVLGLRISTPFERALGYRFRSAELLELALTHRSHANERGTNAHYERLEFLGDAVVGLIAGEWLYENFPDVQEGELSRLKSSLVSATALGAVARELGLGGILRLGVGEERSGGREKSSLLADSMEAVFGALFLDGGLKASRGVIVPIIERAMSGRPPGARADSKTALQEAAQGRGWPLPEYRVVSQEGPDHQKVFTVECWLQGESLGSAQGESKKLAEQRAAALALARLASEGVA